MKTSPIRIDTRGTAGEPIMKAPEPDSCVMVIFGATGDLCHRKLIPALYNLEKDQSLPNEFRVIGFSRSVPPTDAFRVDLHDSTHRFSRTQPVDEKTWEVFTRRLSSIMGDPSDLKAYARLREELDAIDRQRDSKGNRLYYLATPPSAFPIILKGLQESGLLHPGGQETGQPWSRVVIEKPFGRDLASARELNRLVSQCADESQIFRVDHYLGKETVQNILVFRFGNSIFEPLWSRHYIDHVQITASEELGVERRGAYYDESGVLRDIVQNHLLEIMALCAMEQPISFKADDIRDQKVQLYRSLRPLIGPAVKDEVVRAQYDGYNEEKGVKRDSRTPTYVALRVMIDNWRWRGVPFYLRAGKKLRRFMTEISIHFQTIPFCLFGREDVCQMLEPNVLTIRIQPDEGIRLRFAAKVPGEDVSVGSVTMDFNYERAFQKPLPEAYERLLVDCMRGDATLFARADGVERAWEFATPILEAWDAESKEPIPIYQAGRGGPKEADDLLAREGHRWREL